jgi:hypothetical protein
MAGRTGTDGLNCCGKRLPYRELGYEIIGDGDGGLLWRFLCPVCGAVLRSEAFAFPPDYPDKDQGRVGREA